MNFHIFVVISTIIFYILLRFYKYRIQKKQKGSNSKSNLVYVLFLPLILYLVQFMYINKFDIGSQVKESVINNNNNIGDYVSESLLSTPFPESSISVTKSQ